MQYWFFWRVFAIKSAVDIMNAAPVGRVFTYLRLGVANRLIDIGRKRCYSSAANALNLVIF
jgi:hypothetical protein